ncbi:MAG: HlyD family efflux transporter periplasmic adaptor subunit [Deltaproteobacteria bacterium]|nr:HlyD family efflux transporter periplasmic adaptor subunit [Deltaproteobacteria bacterium]
MIKNSLIALAAFAAAIVGAACDGWSRVEEPEAFQGVVELDERSIGFEVGGRLVELHVDRGSRVEPGAPIGRIDDGLERPVREARAAEQRAAQAQLAIVRAGARGEEVRGTAAELRAAQAAEELLTQRLERQRELTARGVAPSAQVEDLERELGRAQAQRQAVEQKLALVRRGARSEEVSAAEERVLAATAAVAAIDTRLSRYVLAAPVGGTVLDVHFREGEVVAPGAPVVTIADAAHPFVDVFVPQQNVGGVRVGAAARIRVDSFPRALGGRVENVSQRTEFTPRFLFSERERPNIVVRVRVRVEDPRELLRAGVPAFVTLVRE